MAVSCGPSLPSEHAVATHGRSLLNAGNLSYTCISLICCKLLLVMVMPVFRRSLQATRWLPLWRAWWAARCLSSRSASPPLLWPCAPLRPAGLHPPERAMRVQLPSAVEAKRLPPGSPRPGASLLRSRAEWCGWMRHPEPSSGSGRGSGRQGSSGPASVRLGCLAPALGCWRSWRSLLKRRRWPDRSCSAVL